MTQERKAYYCEEYGTGYGKIEYFDNVGQAKAYFANEFQERFVDVRPHRVPWADGYKCQDEIPIEVFFENGWWFECNTCGSQIDELKDLFINERGYCCKSCYKKR